MRVQSLQRHWGQNRICLYINLTSLLTPPLLMKIDFIRLALVGIVGSVL